MHLQKFAFPWLTTGRDFFAIDVKRKESNTEQKLRLKRGIVEFCCAFIEKKAHFSKLFHFLENGPFTSGVLLTPSNSIW